MDKYEDYYWLNKDSRTFLSREYLPQGVTPEQRIRTICIEAEKKLGFNGFADRFENYMKRGWISLSTPIWCNFGAKRGLPISCNGSYIPDDTLYILRKAAEAGAMSKFGAGTSGYFGDVRPRGASISTGGKTNGPVHFMELYDKTTTVISQSSVRRGQYAAYLPIDHPDILEFLAIRSEGHPIQKILIGVTITDDWMQKMLDGDDSKRKIWAKIIKKRYEDGIPYIFFTDTVNKNKPQVYKDKGMQIYASNLCTEIALPSSIDLSFVCNLLSLNALHFFDWKDTNLVEDATYFLDVVMEEYIEKTNGIMFMEAANKFAREHRALGLGVLGWHSFLQSKMIPFESINAKSLNIELFKHIDEKSLLASRKLAKTFGEPEVLKGYGLRNTTRCAVAPTTSSSFILGQVSPSTEPLNGNYFIKDLDKGKFTFKNPFLVDVLAEHKKNDRDTWQSILMQGGSVQHLGFLTDLEKEVFKTFGEISQKEILIQAVGRQKYIDQGQSINFMIHPKTPVRDTSALTIEAWKMGAKTLYYQRSTNPAQELGRSILACSSCEA